ncbi:MAG: exopolysaccharide biosynthesis polyprenyl glycosylphosphotransferase, partial [Aliifodinibius sp.]|nr:exopolysaccharide biosynthesis polyprenyl glycosylphosphotransferase [candidate division Zixibacteria bacterium]NIT55821.1 exopolysaccharide biosynthesis polyprenyl glycosylphosphotransferase [Fodinibius sp.]NIW43986.1 exopolysaccharide biosynthesis polyprenyl glycosylphosphotransferase [Gammaproteobacteria bacterium]NIR63063.1 exopolysaccharide biosynthesis polyprenyl glycosylphosphotransferase [candidate division Zixibacteria bacterium]NIS45073.1 exopolysaccharide biosynthesis polyprenyl g
ALVVLPEVDAHIVEAVTDQQFGDFNRVILVTDLDHISKLGVTTFDLNGTLGLEVHQNLLNLSAQIQKWIMDMVLSIIVLVVLFPLFVLVGLLIKLTSKGPIFYSHSRIGQGGKHFNIFKFRTMYQNADQMLEKYLEENPQYREEWETEQKIRKDPRITPIGRILRKLSIDELPQVWNVIRGEMSLVGPRPIVDEEIEKYADKFAVYKRVKTGITGLWQVSGRNNLPYEERVRLDEYYVRNWSIWLDVYIMARTIWVVLGRDGAY